MGKAPGRSYAGNGPGGPRTPTSQAAGTRPFGWSVWEDLASRGRASGSLKRGSGTPGGPQRTRRIPMDSTKGPFGEALRGQHAGGNEGLGRKLREELSLPASRGASVENPAGAEQSEGTGRRGFGVNTQHCTHRSGNRPDNTQGRGGLTPGTSGRCVRTAPARPAPLQGSKPGRLERQQRGAGRSPVRGQATCGHRVSGRPSAALPGGHPGRGPQAGPL